LGKTSFSPALKGVEKRKETVIYLDKNSLAENSDKRLESGFADENSDQTPSEQNCTIDINSASTNKLRELTGIGPVYAKRIKEKRPFNNLNDLLEVNGIGPTTLENIKSQGCAHISPGKKEEREEDFGK